MKRTGEEIMEIHGDGRILRSSNRKDRHSKVHTSRGPRERRVRLAADTAIQFYDVQDRLGYDRPSKAVDWLIQKAKAAIDNLAELPPTRVLIEPNSPPPPPPLVDENPTKSSAFEPQNMTSFPAHFMHSNELCLSLQSLEENLSSQIPSTYDRNPISSGSSTTNFEETNYPRLMSWNGDVAGNRSLQSRPMEYDFNLQQHSVYSGSGEPVKSSHELLPDFHTWDHEQQQQLRSTISGTQFVPRGLSWGGL